MKPRLIFWCGALCATVLTRQAAAQRHPYPQTHEELRDRAHDREDGGHAHGARSHLFEGLAFLRIHSAEGIAGEILLELHPHASPLGFGVLFGGYGLPDSRGGSFDVDARFVVHLHKPYPLDIRILIGADECLIPSFRTFANATVHFTLSTDIAPVFAPSVSHFPLSWGQGNRDEWRLDLPVGIRVRLPYRGSATYLSATANVIFDDLRFPAPETGTEARPPWTLGAMAVLEQRLF